MTVENLPRSIVGITFAIFLVVQLTSILSGILTKASANIINIGARLLGHGRFGQQPS